MERAIIVAFVSPLASLTFSSLFYYRSQCACYGQLHGCCYGWWKHGQQMEFRMAKKSRAMWSVQQVEEREVGAVLLSHNFNHYLKSNWMPTFDVCVLKLDSVAKPFPQMLQWKGRFLARSTCASWLRRCCCKLLNWMKARPQSDRWHLYGRSPGSRRSEN